MCGKVCLRCKGKTLLGVVNKLLNDSYKETFQPIIWIFTEVEGDGIKSRLSSSIFCTLTYKMNCKPQFSNLFSKHIFTRTPTGKFHKQRVYLFHSLQSVDLSNFLKSHEGDKNVLRKKRVMAHWHKVWIIQVFLLTQNKLWTSLS